MGKLPGPLGAPFRAAHVSIAASLAQIQGDVATATRNIQADWDRIHGKTVRVNFVGSGSGSIAFKESHPGRHDRAVQHRGSSGSTRPAA